MPAVGARAAARDIVFQVGKARAGNVARLIESAALSRVREACAHVKNEKIVVREFGLELFNRNKR